MKIVNVNAKAISLSKMKIINIAKTLLASVKMSPLSKNSCNLDNCFSGTILSINIAKSFNDLIGVDGVILTKLDSDTRGGAALSVKAVTGKPIKFVGIGEKMDALEPFHPDRMASRILGMGDILTLIEKAESQFSLTNKGDFSLKKRKHNKNIDLKNFNLNDFLKFNFKILKETAFFFFRRSIFCHRITSSPYALYASDRICNISLFPFCPDESSCLLLYYNFSACTLCMPK